MLFGEVTGLTKILNELLPLSTLPVIFLWPRPIAVPKLVS